MSFFRICRLFLSGRFMPFLAMILFVRPMFAQVDDECQVNSCIPLPMVVQSQQWRLSQISDIVLAMQHKRVLVIGEEHNDDQGHRLQLEILKAMAERYPIILSLEMLEADQQVIIDEFLSGSIDKKHILASTMLWNNYEKDYHPLVEYSKKHQIAIIAANPPRRYVNLVSRNGLASLSQMPESSYQYLPPLYSIELNRQPEYESRLQKFFGQHKMGNTNVDNLIMAQHLWDASMAHRISEASYRYPEAKIMHINGRFHSDNHRGVAFRLAQNRIDYLLLTFMPFTSKPIAEEQSSNPKTMKQRAETAKITPGAEKTKKEDNVNKIMAQDDEASKKELFYQPVCKQDEFFNTVSCQSTITERKTKLIQSVDQVSEYQALADFIIFTNVRE